MRRSLLRRHVTLIFNFTYAENKTPNNPQHIPSISLLQTFEIVGKKSLITKTALPTATLVTIYIKSICPIW